MLFKRFSTVTKYKTMLRIILLLSSMVFVHAGDVTLTCDESVPGTMVLSGYCTITGLNVTHSQHVVINNDDWSSSGTHYMKFYDSSLLYIPPVIFTQCPQLKRLDVSNSKIVDLPRNTFTGAIALVWLDLSENEIEKITTSAFAGAKNINWINLRRNRITELNEHSFNGLESLQHLDLSENQITTLDAKIFSDNGGIEWIDLRNNQIAKLNAETFQDRRYLKHIDVSGNRLLDINTIIFSGCENIRFIDFSNNSLTEFILIDIGDRVESVSAKYNQIHLFSIACEISCELKSLDLSHNNITDLDNITDFKTLEKLDMSYNNIGRINVSTLAQMNELRQLRLQHTNLTGITFGTFSKQTKLTCLDLSENNLGTINLDMIVPYMYQTLEELYLNGNNLSETVGRRGLSSFPNLVKLDLRRNHFNCSYLLDMFGLPYSRAANANIGDQITNDRSHIYGTECHHNESSKSEDKQTARSPEDYKMLIYRMKIREEQLEQHQLLLRLFVIVIAAIGLGTIVYKFSKLIASKSGTWVNAVSYRSTNTIQSDIDMP